MLCVLSMTKHIINQCLNKEFIVTLKVFFTGTSERYSNIMLKGVQIMCSETKYNTTNSPRQTTIIQCMTKPSSNVGKQNLKINSFKGILHILLSCH